MEFPEEFTEEHQIALRALIEEHGSDFYMYPDLDKFCETLTKAGCFPKEREETESKEEAINILKDIYEFLIREGFFPEVFLNVWQRGGRRIGLDQSVLLYGGINVKKIWRWAKSVRNLSIDGKRPYPQTILALEQLVLAIVKMDFNPTYPLDGKQVHKWLMSTKLSGSDGLKTPSKQTAYNICRRLLDIARVSPPPGVQLLEQGKSQSGIAA